MLVWVHIRCCGNGCLWFRPYGESLFQTPKRNQKALLLRSALAGSGPFAPGSIRAQRLRFASLHLRPLCLATPDGRCAPTPGSIPPLSLPMSLVRQDQKHSSFAHCNEWLEAGGWLGIWVGFAPHRNAARPALSRGRGRRLVCVSSFAFDAELQLDAILTFPAISPLSLRERARVRGF